MKSLIENKSAKIILLCSVLVLSSCQKSILGPESNVPAPTTHYSKLATILDSLRYALDLPALAGAIVTDTGITEAAAVGCRRYGGEANVTINDQFHLGSCGKSFTAVLMGTFVDEGKVNWNTTLPEIFPEYTNIIRSEYKTVTVRDILTHSAGFIRDPNKVKFQTSTPREKRIEVLQWALNQPPAKQKGTFLYSNLGYMIAGSIIEKLANRSYEELLMERVIKPLGLSTAGIGVMGTEGKEDQPLQHTPNHAPIIAKPDAGLDPIYNPAGGLYMSVTDWGKYCQWVLIVENGGKQSLLKDATARMITTPYVDEGGGWKYAMGWGTGDVDWAGGKSLQHSGSNSFNYSTVWLAPNKNFGIVVMTNQGPIGEEWPLEKPFFRILDYYQKGR